MVNQTIKYIGATVISLTLFGLYIWLMIELANTDLKLYNKIFYGAIMTCIGVGLPFATFALITWKSDSD